MVYSLRDYNLQSSPRCVTGDLTWCIHREITTYSQVQECDWRSNMVYSPRDYNLQSSPRCVIGDLTWCIHQEITTYSQV